MHIGILQTDTVLTELQAQFGDYPHMVERVLRQAGSPDLVVRTWDVRETLPDPTVCAGYVITGSRASVYDDLPWMPGLVRFIREAVAAGRKVVGICFGHQLLAHYFGGRVGPAAAGWAVGVHRSQVLAQADWMQPARAEIALLSSHKDQVQSLPPGARLLATNAFCPVAAFSLGDQLLAIQGHPEFTKDYSRALLEKRRTLLGETVYQSALESLAEATDEQVLAGWILNFIAGDSPA